MYLLWPVGNAQIGRNSLQTLQKRTPLQSGTVVSLEEFTTSGSSGLTQPDSSTSESESLSLAVKWVYFEDDELHAVGVEKASDMLSLLDFFYCLRKVVVKKTSFSVHTEASRKKTSFKKERQKPWARDV